MNDHAEKTERGVALTIPAPIVAEAGLEPGQPVDVTVSGKALIIRPAGAQASSPLDQLLAQATADNRHTRIEPQS